MTEETKRDWVLVTGGSRGIGRAIAIAVGAQSMHVVVNYRSNAEQAAAVVDQIHAAGGSAEALAFDVANGEACASAAAALQDRKSVG